MIDSGSRFTATVVPTGEPWNENCYVVLDRERNEQIIVDPGGRADAIRSAAEASGARVVAVAITHAHHDHVRAAVEVARHFDVSCHLHSADFPLLRRAPSYSLVFGGEAFPAVAKPVALDTPPRLFWEPEMVILHTPGHTPGSCCFLFPGFVLTGDTLLFRRVGRTDLPGCDRKALIASVDALLEHVGDDDMLYPGHREPWTAGEAKAWWAAAREDAPALDKFDSES